MHTPHMLAMDESTNKKKFKDEPKPLVLSHLAKKKK